MGRPQGRAVLTLAVGVLLMAAGSVALTTARPPPAPTVVVTPAPTPAVLAGIAPAPRASPHPRPASPEPVRLAPASPKLAAFAGLSTWVDVYDVDRSPAEHATSAAEAGVQTLFVQSARFASPTDIQDPARFAALIEAAHDRGLSVVAWYVPDFVDLERDFRRAQAAVGFVSPRGDRPDAFGLDIEREDVTDAPERTRRLLALSEALRVWAGDDYPMAAIVLPPLQLELRPGWWPGFPYATLRKSFDVFVPMSYSSFRGQDAATTYRWSHQNVLRLRERAGDPDLPVHLAGGIADRLPEVGAFVAAAADSAVLGAGLYDLATTPGSTWAELRRLRAPG